MYDPAEAVYVKDCGFRFGTDMCRKTKRPAQSRETLADWAAEPERVRPPRDMRAFAHVGFRAPHQNVWLHAVDVVPLVFTYATLRLHGTSLGKTVAAMAGICVSARLLGVVLVCCWRRIRH